MKQLVLPLSLCLLLSTACSDPAKPGTSKNASAKPLDPANEKEFECTCFDTVVSDGSRKFFPFSAAKSVRLYEYKANRYEVAAVTAEKAGLRDGKIFPDSVIEKTAELSPAEIGDLEKLILNRGQRCNDGTVHRLTDCAYNPHHCVVFSDDAGKTIAYVEMCFICEEARSWTQSGSLGPLCGDFGCDFAYLFVKHGFKKDALLLEMCDALKYEPDLEHPSQGHFPE